MAIIGCAIGTGSLTDAQASEPSSPPVAAAPAQVVDEAPESSDSVARLAPTAGQVDESANERLWKPHVNSPLAKLTHNGRNLFVGNAKGGLSFSLSPSVIFEHGQPGKQSRTIEREVDNWRVKRRGHNWQLLGSVTTDFVRCELQISGVTNSPRLEIAATVTYLQPCEVSREVLRFRLSKAGDAPPKVLAMDRAYRLRHVTRAHVMDRWTPQVVFAGQGAMAMTMVGHGQALVAKQGTDNGFFLELELDNVRNHPLRIARDCWPRYSSEQEKMRDDKGAQWRKTGTSHQAKLHVYASDIGVIRKRRYRSGFRSALVFTDHADQSDSAKLEALMYGRGYHEATANQHKANAGFAGRGLGMTKTVFARHTKGYARQLDDARYYRLVADLIGRHGPRIEIGPHSASGAPDSRAQTEEGLEALKELAKSKHVKSQVWIDHQPTTNCEAITNRGAQSGDPHQVTDLLERFDYKYVWAGHDSPAPRDGINLFDPGRPSKATPVLYQHTQIGGNQSRLWLFASLWRAMPFERFLKFYSQSKLDTLVHDHGLHIAHTYLDTYRRKGRLGAWSLLEPSTGGYRLKPEADKLFARLEERQSRKEVLVTSLSGVADHMLHMKEVEIVYEADGSASLHNAATRPIVGASFAIPFTDVEIQRNGSKLASAQLRKTTVGTEFWMDLVAGERVSVTLTKTDGTHRPFAEAVHLQPPTLE